LPKKTLTVSKKIFKADRKRKKDIFEAKKATNEAKKINLKRKHEEAREGTPYLIKLNK
jgi:hypothetical protein